MNSDGYSNLSKDEVFLISKAEFDRLQLITGAYARTLYNSNRKAADVLSRLTNKGRLIQIQRGKYLLVPIKAPNQQWSPNEYEVAALWMGEAPYYVAYFTAFNYWGFTEQIPQTVYIANLKMNEKKTIGKIKYEAVKIDRKKYYGIKTIVVNGTKVCISDKERTLVDFVCKPLGSINNIETVMKNFVSPNNKGIDLDKFVRYLIKYPVISVRKRAGFFMEKAGCAQAWLDKLKNNLGPQNSYAALDPDKPTRKGPVDRTWRIIDNR